MPTPGTLYFLTNPSMPGLVKIGHTTGPVEQRVLKLSSTGVPSPFAIVATFSVSDSAQCEVAVHKRLEQYRSNPKREFFSGDTALLIGEAFEALAPFLDAVALSTTNEQPAEVFKPDEDDIYFMFYLLHDCYEKGTSWPSGWLAENHLDYSPITVDLKLMTLEEHGYVKRTNRIHEGAGEWTILPKGVRFMIDNNHHDQALLDESKARHTL